MRLETTTIYTKVALLKQKQVQSPLDAFTGKASPRSPEQARAPVGRMKIDVQLWPNQQAADAKLTILSGDRYVFLDGIVVREPRSGWVTLELPPLEAWETSMRWLTPPQRERIESPEFYALVQEHVARRYLALRGRPF